MERRSELVTALLLAFALGVACGKSAPPVATPPATEDAGAVAERPAPPPEATGPRAVSNVADAADAVGQRVRVEGTARNAKLSAVVAVGDLIVYCLDLPEWPDERANQPVVVQGMLEHTDEHTPDPGGPISAGTGGPIYAIRTCTVEPPR